MQKLDFMLVLTGTNFSKDIIMHQIQISYCVNGEVLLEMITITSTSEESLEWATKAVYTSLKQLIPAKDRGIMLRIFLTIEKWCRQLKRKR